jgi:hypothetical protein
VVTRREAAYIGDEVEPIERAEAKSGRLSTAKQRRAVNTQGNFPQV